LASHESSVGLEVFTAVTMKDYILWDVAPCGSCKNQRFGRTCCHHLQGRKIPLARKSVSSLIFSTLKMEVTRSSETSVLTNPYGATSHKTTFSWQDDGRMTGWWWLQRHDTAVISWKLKLCPLSGKTIIIHQLQPFYTLVKFHNTHFLIPLGMKAFPASPITFLSQTQRRMGRGLLRYP
jgi:hypothetical protein